MSRSKKPKRESASPLGQSQRQLRVGELVRHAVASLLARGEVHDPVIEGHLITVPEVRMSPDLRFHIDNRFEEAERIDKLLRSPQVRRDLEKDDAEKDGE